MNILPRLNFLFQIILVRIEDKQLVEKSANFIWSNNKRSQVKIKSEKL